MYSVFSTSATVSPSRSTIRTRNVGSYRAPCAVALRARATVDAGRRKCANTSPRPGLRYAIDPALSQTTYSGPRLRSIISAKNGSVIANIEPPNWVPK